jgi:hypothetical protein
MQPFQVHDKKWRVKMTDKEKVKKFLEEMGIGFDVDSEGFKGNHIVIVEGEHKKVTGYGRFFACFNFEEDDSFKDVSIAE